MKFGLKLWSINPDYIPEAIRLYELGIYQYIELYAIPDSYDAMIKFWKSLRIPFIIHAPHYKHGLNLSQVQFQPVNLKLAKESYAFADALNADTVIIHPGMNGPIEETVRQIRFIYDDRLVIENKPQVGLGELTCTGATPQEIQFAMDQTGVGFCLDIGHAICAANSHHIDPITYIRQFIQLAPQMYHVTDGNVASVYDQHDHYGQGSFPLAEILTLIPPHSRITNEATKDDPIRLDDFVKDMSWLTTVSTLVL